MEHDRRLVRQWSVTITEDTTTTALNVLLRWRTFPCSAQHWDGVASARVESDGRPIQSQEALRAVLLDLAAEEWQTGPVVRR